MSGRAGVSRTSRAGPNPVPADRLATPERLDEICAILALALVRLKARDAGKPFLKSGLDLHSPPDRSGHANPTHEEIA